MPTRKGVGAATERRGSSHAEEWEQPRRGVAAATQSSGSSHTEAWEPKQPSSSQHSPHHN
eukprot:364811-Chlamydomonas_euryale.AAC.9